MGRIEDSLNEARLVDQQLRAAKMAEEEVRLREYRLVEELGDNAVGQEGFSRSDVVPKVKSTIGRALIVCGYQGYEVPEVAETLDGVRDGSFMIGTRPALVCDGAISLQLAVSDRGSASGSRTFWELLELEGVKHAAHRFCGASTLSILATDPANNARIANVELSPSSFVPVSKSIYERFCSGPFPLMNLAPLASPYHNEEGWHSFYDNASHLTDDQLVWAAGLDARFNMYLDLIEDQAYR